MSTATLKQPLELEVHVCAQRRSYKATFATDEQAVAFIEARTTTHAIFPWVEPGQEAPSPEGDWDAYPLTMAALYPTCEHGLSATLCYGPGHYPSAEVERSWEV